MSNQRLSRDGSFFKALTMWDRGDQMVGDVIMGNVVQEEATNPTEKRAINSRDSPTNKGPRVLAEVGHGGISVM